MKRYALPLICLVALGHAAFYIAHQRPDWNTAWTDQGGYKQLGAALATSGRFTRALPGDPFIPESIRTPGYPLFVAAVYRVAGVDNHLAVAIAQGVVFAAICLMVYWLALRLVSERTALLAAGLTALFSPIPYFGALVMTEVWTTFLLTATVLATFRAREALTVRAGVLAGLLAASTALTRPVFVLLPLALFGLMAIIDGRARRRVYSVALASAVLLLLPWFAYNYVYFNRITVSPANGFGRAVWEASWQGVWNGRLQNDLTTIADRLDDRPSLDAEVTRLAEAERLDPAPMLDYVHQWQDIRRMWTGVTDRQEWMLARITADSEYFRVGVANITRDPGSYLKRRFMRAIPVLWISHIPYRHSGINELPVWSIRLMWALQAALIGLAALGVWTGVAGGRWREAVLLAVPFVYITGVHAPLLTEVRQSLPGMPTVLVLAATGLTSLRLLRPHDAPART